jgi:DNA-binding NarL/FixJ family response regulator
MKKITVLLTDDHAVVRQGLRALLEAEPDIDVVGEAESGRQALVLAEKLRPDVIIMDIAMPLLNGLEATRQITRKFPSCRVLVLSSYSDDDYVQQLTEAGAAGYMVKQTASNELIKAIREANKGNAYFSPSIAKRLRDHCRDGFHRGDTTRKVGARLTSRELEVLQLIAEGHANKQIASELAISIKTVEKHRQQAMDKLNIHDIAGLTRYAIMKGIIEPHSDALQLRNNLGLAPNSNPQSPTASPNQLEKNRSPDNATDNLDTPKPEPVVPLKASGQEKMSSKKVSSRAASTKVASSFR